MTDTQVTTNDSIGLYIHIPFCKSICPYCSFYKIKWNSDLENDFILALVQELTFYATHSFKKPLHSIFFGGGTPTLLSKSHWETIFDCITTNFEILPHCEITTEANPETITADLLSFLPTLGINRLSVGIQSIHQNELHYLGRDHTPSIIKNALNLIHSSTFTNVNYDLIFGTKIGNIDLLQQSLHYILQFNPTHISTYALSIEPNTPFERKKITPIDSDLELDHYKYIIDILEKHHFQHYEISAFSLPGFESKHNLTYWNYKDFIGVGPSACSFVQEKRYTQPSNITDYIKQPSPKRLIQDTQSLTQDEQIQEFIMSTLRLKQGLSLQQFKTLFKCSIFDVFNKALTKLIDDNFLMLTPTHIKTTKKGLYLLNEILLEFLD